MNWAQKNEIILTVRRFGAADLFSVSSGLMAPAPDLGVKVAFRFFIQYASKQASSTDDSVPPRFLSIKVYVVPKGF